MGTPAMTRQAQPDRWDIDPRRSLAAGAMWLIIALATTFSLETDQLSSELGLAIAARQGAVRAARILLDGVGVAGRQNGLAAVFDELQSAYPELEWLAIA